MPFDCISYPPQDPILRVLSAAQERIREPENWCQKSYGGDDGPNCAVGALWTVARGCDYRPAYRLLNMASRELSGRIASFLNDTTDHPTVMVMFSRAIELRLADMAKEAVHAL